MALEQTPDSLLAVDELAGSPEAQKRASVLSKLRVGRLEQNLDSIQGSDHRLSNTSSHSSCQTAFAHVRQRAFIFVRPVSRHFVGDVMFTGRSLTSCPCVCVWCVSRLVVKCVQVKNGPCRRSVYCTV